MFGSRLTVTNHDVDLNALKQLDATRIPYQKEVLDKIKKKIDDNTLHLHRGTIVTLPANHFGQFITAPMTISQSFHQHHSSKTPQDTVFIYWQALGGDMMLTLSQKAIEIDKDQSGSRSLLCYIADTAMSKNVYQPYQGYSYVTYDLPFSHDMLEQSDQVRAKSNSFHLGCNIDDYITYCLTVGRRTGEATLRHVGANSLYNHQTISCKFSRAELDLSTLDYVQISARRRIVPVRNLVIRHEPIEEYRVSFDRDFKADAQTHAAASKSRTDTASKGSLASPKDDEKSVGSSFWGYLKKKILPSGDASLVACRDSVNCLTQYSPKDAESHNREFSHPCRFSELCKSKSDHPHLEHITHSVPMCSYDTKCRKLGDPVHRAQHRHSDLPDYLYPCRDQPRCDNRNTEHRIRYSHGEKVPIPSSSGMKTNVQ